MSDIVKRLRAWVHAVDAVSASDLMDEAADEIERLRLSSRGDCPEPENAADEDKVFPAQNMTTLTKHERDVLRDVCRVYADEDDVGCNEISFVIDRMLARLGGESRTGSGNEMVGEDAAKCTVKSKKCPERDRLTDDEREAVEWVVRECYAGNIHAPLGRLATLRGLLKRLSNPPATDRP